MAFSPAFTVSQSAATPANVTLTDTSTGSDVSITQRRVYITDNNGNYLVPSGTSTDYIQWAYATNPLLIEDLLTQDQAVTILVQWLDSGDNVLYSASNYYCLREFNKQNFISIIQAQALSPGIVQDTTYFGNLCEYWINITGANVLVEDAGDLSGSQNCLNRATNIANNDTYFF